MIRSRAEVYALTMRAACGAGLPVGHAEDLAHSAVIALASDPACGPQIVQALGAGYDPEDCVIAGDTMHLAVSPAVWVAPLICDALDSGIKVIAAHDVDCPALLAALPGVRLAWVGDDCTIVADQSAAAAVVRRGPLTIDAATWAALEALAARRLVPETTASRRAGAGAGVLDAD